MSASREEIYQALFAVVSDAYQWNSAPSRRLKLWGDVPLGDRPALFQFEGEPDAYAYSAQPILSSQKRTIHAKLFAYIDAKDPTIVGSSQINAILDAFDAAIAPDNYDTGLFTLGGLVYSCLISGVPLRDPGDLDGDGLTIVDVEMLLP